MLVVKKTCICILHTIHLLFHPSYFSGLRPRILHHYRGHKMSIWLSLIPQLQKTGQNSIYPSHNSLLLDGGPSWGVVRNASFTGGTSNMMANIDNKAKNGLSPPSTTCMTLSESAQVCLTLLFYTALEIQIANRNIENECRAINYWVYPTKYIFRDCLGIFNRKKNQTSK